MLRILLLSWSLVNHANAQDIWKEYRHRPRSEFKQYLVNLGRDSLLRIAIHEAVRQYPDFDPAVFPYVHVTETSSGIHVSFEMAIRFLRYQKQGYYDFHINLVQRSLGTNVLGDASAGTKPAFFKWDEESRKAVRTVLHLESTVLPDTLSYRDGLQVTITDQGESYLVSREARSGSFESYRLDKKTGKMSEHLHGDAGPEAAPVGREIE